MAECDRAGCFNFKSYLRDFVTLDAFINIKGTFPFMACAARFPLSHVLHSVMVFVSKIEDRVMTGFAIIFNSGLFEMLTVAEYHCAEICSFEGYILDVNRKGIRRKKQRHNG